MTNYAFIRYLMNMLKILFFTGEWKDEDDKHEIMVLIVEVIDKCTIEYTKLTSNEIVFKYDIEYFETFYCECKNNNNDIFKLLLKINNLEIVAVEIQFMTHSLQFNNSAMVTGHYKSTTTAQSTKTIFEDTVNNVLSNF